MDEVLAVRAAAGDLLRLATKQTIAFDPFAEKAERQKQADAWRKWVSESQPDSKPEPEKPADPPEKPAADAWPNPPAVRFPTVRAVQVAASRPRPCRAAPGQ